MSDNQDESGSIVESNRKTLLSFHEYLLQTKKFSAKKSQIYATAMQFFADEFLLHYEEISLFDGLQYFDPFLTDWFLRKCMWSDVTSVKLNGKVFECFLTFLDSIGHEFSADDLEMRAHLPNTIMTAVKRAEAYNNPDSEMEDIFDDFGEWLDEDIEENTKPPESKMQKSPHHVDIHVIFSAKAAKFLKLKPPELVKLSEWDQNWADPDIHWLRKWRCEECFSMKGTKARVFIVTNDASRYSFLLRLEPGDVGEFYVQFSKRMLKLHLDQQFFMPVNASLQIHFLSGSAQSLTTAQNHLIDYVDRITERKEFQFIDEIEIPLNLYLTTIEGEYRYPVKEMARLLKDKPLFSEIIHPGSNVIPMWN